MSYGVVWDHDAARAVLGLSDPGLASAVLDGADRLALAPTRLSRPDGWPHYGVEQRYAFDVAGRQVTPFFHYSQEERHLPITDVSILPPL